MRFAMLFVFVVTGATGVVSAQIRAALGAPRTFDHPATGIRFKYPRSFKPIQIQPTEKLIIARFQRSKPFGFKAPKNVRGRRFRQPGGETFDIFVLKSGTTGGEKGPAKNYDDVIAAHNSATTVREFLHSRYRTGAKTPLEVNLTRIDGKSRSKREIAEFTLRLGRRESYVFTVRDGSETWGVVGHYATGVGEAKPKIWRTLIKAYRKIGIGIERPDGYGAVRDPAKFYKNKKDKYRDIPFRVEARRRLSKGWKALDTENFFIAYHTDNRSLVRRIAEDLESIRPVYEKYFPSEKPIDAVSIVRVCRDRDEYLRYGAPPTSGGYWSSLAKELVFYDYSKRPPSQAKNKKWKPKKQDTYIVLYHEAFHQYIYYAAGQLAPHMWFNEGLGDFFSGTTLSRLTKKLKKVDLNRWRIHTVKDAERNEKFMPLDKFFRANRSMYYNPRMVGMMYAQGWSLCYFLMESKEAAANEKWKNIIPTYFATLKDVHRKAEALLGEEATLADKTKTEGKSRELAITKALDGVDVIELEDAWRRWLRKTKDPWASKRGKKNRR